MTQTSEWRGLKYCVRASTRPTTPSRHHSVLGKRYVHEWGYCLIVRKTYPAEAGEPRHPMHFHPLEVGRDDYYWRRRRFQRFEHPATTEELNVQFGLAGAQC